MFIAPSPTNLRRLRRKFSISILGYKHFAPPERRPSKEILRITYWLRTGKVLLKTSRSFSRLPQIFENGLRGKDGIGQNRLYERSCWATGVNLRDGCFSTWAMQINQRIQLRTIRPTGALLRGRFIRLQELGLLGKESQGSNVN
jgi:hypothetical protein